LEGQYELEQLETFFAWMGECARGVFEASVALDVGANIGNHSLYFSDYFRKVYSFEPNNRTYKLLRLNAELVNNVVCHNVGLSDTERSAFLNVEPSNVGGSNITHNLSPSSEIIELKTLDSMVTFPDDIALIKIDVEGHEYEVLQGSRHTIEQHHPVIVFELGLADFSAGQSRVVTLLRSYGYSRFASIRSYPRASIHVNRFVRQLTAVIGRSVLGESMQVVDQGDIEPDSYNFMVALPNWLDVAPPREA